ncbi:50S ribosomal protein L6 [Parcubacteria bacterium DG_74_3]|nr:MAG: 50S ribosomal protein L6 [Parcubacteria bacterium DG_74_3]
MSRVGKKPIQIPEHVEVKIEGQKVIIRGPKGELQEKVRPEIKVEAKENKIFLSPKTKIKKSKALWGLFRSLLFNMVKGVTEGFEKQLEIEGIGFKASTEGDNLILEVGFTHPVRIKAPENVKFLVEKNIITVSGIDKGKVSLIAAQIRKVKPPEPYKGKGIRYFGEVVRRKAGKKAVTAG